MELCVPPHARKLRFLEVALAGSKVDFSKVIKMIESMVALLKEEQTEDDHKNEYTPLHRRYAIP